MLCLASGVWWIQEGPTVGPVPRDAKALFVRERDWLREKRAFAGSVTDKSKSYTAPGSRMSFALADVLSDGHNFFVYRLRRKMWAHFLGRDQRTGTRDSTNLRVNRFYCVTIDFVIRWLFFFFIRSVHDQRVRAVLVPFLPRLLIAEECWAGREIVLTMVPTHVGSLLYDLFTNDPFAAQTRWTKANTLAI